MSIAYSILTPRQLRQDKYDVVLSEEQILQGAQLLQRDFQCEGLSWYNITLMEENILQRKRAINLKRKRKMQAHRRK